MNEEELNLVKASITGKSNMAKAMMWVALISVVINIFGATAFWFALPEKFKAMMVTQSNMETRLETVEVKTTSQATMLAAIDERTRIMQDDIRWIKNFSFHASGNPTN